MIFYKHVSTDKLARTKFFQYTSYWALVGKEKPESSFKFDKIFLITKWPFIQVKYSNVS